MSNNWNYASNTFLLFANRNQKRFYKFVYSFMEALFTGVSDPKINDLYQQLLPYYAALKAAYSDNKSQAGIRKGDTKEQTLLFGILQKEKMPYWYRKIVVEYPPKSSDFIKIFPQGLTPFDKATLEERLIYLNNIINILGNYLVFAPIVVEMKEFRDKIVTARNTQQHSGIDVKMTSYDLKAKSEAMAKEIFGALGLLMYHFRDNPENILLYFKVSLLHYNQKTKEESTNIYDLVIPVSGIKEGGFSFTLLQKLLLYNSGETKLRCWFGELPDSPIPLKYIDLEADAEVEVIIDKYATAKDKFFFIQNLSTTQEGSIEIEIV